MMRPRSRTLLPPHLLTTAVDHGRTILSDAGGLFPTPHGTPGPRPNHPKSRRIRGGSEGGTPLLLPKARGAPAAVCGARLRGAGPPAGFCGEGSPDAKVWTVSLSRAPGPGDRCSLSGHASTSGADCLPVQTDQQKHLFVLEE